MLKLRLKKCGRKGQVSYRLVVMLSTMKRDGRAIEELGFYNPRTKEISLNKDRIKSRLKQGVKPTLVIENLLKKLDLFY
jgi:small subunit ribosomal protein S16